jgi:hypothetical protein
VGVGVRVGVSSSCCSSSRVVGRSLLLAAAELGRVGEERDDNFGGPVLEFLHVWCKL